MPKLEPALVPQFLYIRISSHLSSCLMNVPKLSLTLKSLRILLLTIRRAWNINSEMNRIYETVAKGAGLWKRGVFRGKFDSEREDMSATQKIRS